MPSVTYSLIKKNVIKPPRFLENAVVYEAIMGSVAYGVSSDTSDMDIYGICVPPKDIVFPHTAGHIHNFGRQRQEFEQFQQDHVATGDKSYDISIYNIVKFFNLLMDNNPNIIDSIFVPFNCIVHSTQVGNMIRENRRLFLHKGAWHKFKGYAYSQLNKIKNKQNATSDRRKELIEKHGYDTKFGYHVVRLLYEVEQIMSIGDIDMQRDREHLKSIRRGDVSEQDLRDWAANKERELEKLYHESLLQYGPDEGKIKTLLLNCLEAHYGSIDGCIVNPDQAVAALREIAKIIDANRKILEQK